MELHKMLDHRTQETQIQVEATSTIFDTTQQGLETKIAEVEANFLEGFATTQHEFKMQLAEF
jgi:hypothetical protein